MSGEAASVAPVWARAKDLLPFFFFFQVLSPAGWRVRGHVRSRQRDERRHPQLLPEGVLVQTGLLPALFLLLSLQVSANSQSYHFTAAWLGFSDAIYTRCDVERTFKRHRKAVESVFSPCSPHLFCLMKYGLRLGELLTADGRPGGTERKETTRKTN